MPYPTAANPHYVVLLSPDRMTTNADFPDLNGLVCSTLRPPDRRVREHEVFLDPADGFENKTACRCHLVVKVSRDEILVDHGSVSTVRRLAIKQKFRELFGL